MDTEAVNNARHGLRLLLVTLLLTSIGFFIYYVYRQALPKPLPGIPCDEVAAKKVLGSLPSMFSHWKQHGVVMPWLTGHNLKHNPPLVQFFGAPFAQPTVILSDFQESQDILLRRGKECDRADRTLQSFEGMIPHHHLAMRTNGPRFKGNKELVRYLMSPKFLHEASAVQIYEKSLALIDLWSLKVKTSGGKPFPARQDIFDAALDMVSGAAFGFKDDLSITKRQLNHFLSNGVKFKEHENGSVDFHGFLFFGYIVAGHETTSSSLSWALKFIADHQTEQDKLRQALWEAFPDAAAEKRVPNVKITTTHVPYLDGIIDECMRLETSQTKITVGSWSVDDMHLFKPERWLKTGDSGELVYDS
ncbi:cytochrome P450 [Dactylonectria macrodidyma]|uniref:Cytochrome P450 n=1 Tax=Dactylonectria macrodidyma TaxID=307937 RepID=A0A9P9DTZ8_9HYPO|nr:cytochrome P450 [Dactylonectria macrodidyma]